MDNKNLLKRAELYITLTLGTDGMADYYQKILTEKGIESYRANPYDCKVQVNCESFRNYFKEFHNDCPPILGAIKHEVLYKIYEYYNKLRSDGLLVAPHLEKYITD